MTWAVLDDVAGIAGRVSRVATVSLATVACHSVTRVTSGRCLVTTGERRENGGHDPPPSSAGRATIYVPQRWLCRGCQVVVSTLAALFVGVGYLTSNPRRLRFALLHPEVALVTFRRQPIDN